MPFKLSPLRRLFASNPVQSFTAESPQLQFKGCNSGTPRIYKDLDMKKVNTYQICNTWNPKPTFPTTGYQGDALALPSVHAMTQEEIAAHFTVKDYHKHFSWYQLYQHTKDGFAFQLALHGAIVGCLVPFLFFVLYLQKWEPMEVFIDPDEYYQDYRWHYYGPHLDHHAYLQYLEARRAVKWREADINPRDWIPEEYKGLQ